MKAHDVFDQQQQQMRQTETQSKEEAVQVSSSSTKESKKKRHWLGASGVVNADTGVVTENAKSCNLVRSD